MEGVGGFSLMLQKTQTLEFLHFPIFVSVHVTEQIDTGYIFENLFFHFFSIFFVTLNYIRISISGVIPKDT